MICAHCGKTNRSGARFCDGCGKALAARCPVCHVECRPEAQFCDACGASLTPRPADPAEVRKVVTIVFADLIGSTALHERLDAESVRSLMGRYYGALHGVVEAHGGRVVKLLGDGVMAAFGLPRVAEDDALRAVRAAVAMQEAFRALARVQSGIGLRVAVNTGEVVVDAATDDVVGDPINVAARLQDVARDGDVVIGEATRRLVAASVTLEPLGPVALKGRAETVAAYRVVSLERPAGTSAVAFVGREEELARLAAVYDAARAAPAARLAVILGSPGVGKSRLLDEFTSRLDGATVLVAHCDAAGGATFAPIATALRTVLRVAAGSGGHDLRAAIDAAVPGGEADRSRIAAGIGALLAGTPAAPEETFFVVRRLLTGLASAQPVVLVLDDLQWAAPLLLDLVEHLVQWSTGVPLLLLATARPDLRESRSALAAPGRLATDVVMLSGLDAAAATRLAANVLGAGALPAAVAGRVLATSEGNPLFLGELVRMLVDDGVLKREGDRWTAGVDLAALDMPATIHALLAARIERLRPEDRVVLERAAIVGRQFSRAAVAQLLPREAQGDLDARVEALRRSELIEPDTTWFLGEPALRFHHGLIRDAAYRRVLKSTRAELHERVADWIESRVEGAVEHDETIGWHFEQAHRHLGQLGPLDARGRALGERAARYLAAAGRRALARDDLPLAASLLGRALARLDAADPARADLALDWCEALLAAGDVGPAPQALDELGRFTADSPRLRAWHTCFAGERAALTDPTTLRATADAVAAAADELAAAGDGAGEAKAHWVHALALGRLGKVGASEAALDKALAAARRADDRRRSNAVLANAPLAALWGPSPVTRASGRCLDVVRVLRITEGAPGVEAVALRCQAVLEALRGRAEAARRMIASSRHMVEELGITQQLLETDVFAGLIDLLEGDAVAAERCLRGAYEGLRSHGLGIDAARAAAFLGRALLAQGRAAEAEALSHDSEALAGDDLQAAITWRGVRAEALAQRGLYVEGVDFARAAVDIASATDALINHADARLALASALRAAGRHDDADAEEKRAIELWEAKGATLLPERVRQAVGRAEQARVNSDRIAPARAVRRRVAANAATAAAARTEAIIAARDVDALPTLLADGQKTVHHPTGLVYDRQGGLASWRSLLRADDPSLTLEPLASLGDSLALFRESVSASRIGRGKFDVGNFERDEFALLEVDARGQNRLAEIFAADRLGDAVIRLYDRYADLLPDGPARVRAAATAHSMAAMAAFDLDRIAGASAPSIEYVDRRSVVGLGHLRGAAALDMIRVELELSPDLVNRMDDVLALRSDGFLARLTSVGTDRDGGAHERSFLALCIFGDDGLATRWEDSDVDRVAEALARFDELTAEPAAVRFAAAPSRVATRRERRVRPNAATANAARVDAAIAARDVDALSGLYADDLEIIDHTTSTTHDRQGELPTWQGLQNAEDGRYRSEPLATLGGSLLLCRGSTSASGFAGRKFDVGAYEKERIGLLEVDAEGRQRRCELFAPDRLGDAVARLYERYADLLPNGPERARAAATARSLAVYMGPEDPDRFAATLAPLIDYVDHRTIGMEATRGAEGFLRVLRALHEVADDVANRVDDVLALRPDAGLVRVTNFGTDRAGGGPYERPFLSLFVLGADGLLTRFEQFDADRDAEALARFDELTPEPPPTARITNAATWSWDRFREAWEARDWERVAAIYAPGFRLIDQRPLVRLDLDRDGYLQTMRLIFEMSSSRFTANVLATRGERLLLFRVLLEGTDRDVGPSEIEWLAVVEVDDAGDRVAMVHLDPDDLDEAYAELDRRYAAGEAAPYARTWETLQRFVRAVAARDWEEPTSVFDPHLVFEDHRPIGWGTLRSGNEYLTRIRALVDLAPDVMVHLDHILALDNRGTLGVGRWVGSREGGPFEIPFVAVSVLGPDARIQRIDTYNPEQLDAARARFEALRVGAARDPLAALVRPNAASAPGDRWLAALAARDWAAIRALCAPDAKFEDRRRLALVSGDVDWWIADAQRTASMPNTRIERQRVGTAGDRVTLERILWTGDPGGAAAAAATESRRISSLGPFEIEFLWVAEVDESGRITAGIRFDVDDWRAATREACARWFARDAVAAASVEPVLELVEAMNEHDRTRLRAALADDFVLDDHRPARLGLIAGADAWAGSWAALLDLAPDAQIALGSTLAYARYGSVGLARTFGTLRDGGTFENPTVSVAIVADGRITRLEMFEPEHVDAALARFAELRPDPLRIPPNAATRAWDRATEAGEAQKWDAIRALCAPTLEFDDRRRGLRTSGDLETWLASMRYIFSHRARVARTLLATSGDRLALYRDLWTGADEQPAYEIDTLSLTEVDAEGRIVARIIFDPDDRRAARAEMLERYARSDEARWWPASVLEVARAIYDHDLNRMRAALPDDFFVHDHRRTGIGRIEGADNYVASVAALNELSPDAMPVTLYDIVEAKHGSLSVGGTVGTLTDGGEFESVFVRLMLFQGGRFVGSELFEVEDLDVARARFEQLRLDPRDQRADGESRQ